MPADNVACDSGSVQSSSLLQKLNATFMEQTMHEDSVDTGSAQNESAAQEEMASIQETMSKLKMEDMVTKDQFAESRKWHRQTASSRFQGATTLFLNNQCQSKTGCIPPRTYEEYKRMTEECVTSGNKCQTEVKKLLPCLENAWKEDYDVHFSNAIKWRECLPAEWKAATPVEQCCSVSYVEGTWALFSMERVSCTSNQRYQLGENLCQGVADFDQLREPLKIMMSTCVRGAGCTPRSSSFQVCSPIKLKCLMQVKEQLPCLKKNAWRKGNEHGIKWRECWLAEWGYPKLGSGRRRRSWY